MREIEGYGTPIENKDRYDAVLKFYRNQGEPLKMRTIPVEPIPYVTKVEGRDVIAWEEPEVVESHIIIERNGVLAREADLLPGVYYSMLGMRAGGFRYVAIPPHLYAHTMHEMHGIDKESVVKLEIFLTAIR